jgi:transposase-like protein
MLQKWITTMAERRSTGILLSRHDREVIGRWSRSRTFPARVVLRSRIVLMLDANRGVTAVASALRVAPATVRLWRARFLASGPQGLLNEATGRGRKPTLDLATRETLRTEADVAGVPSVRSRARELGVSAATVSRWRRGGQ